MRRLFILTISFFIIGFASGADEANVIYVDNDYSTNETYVYKVNPTTGIATKLATLPFAEPYTWLDPYTNIIYSQKDSTDKIYAYDIASGITTELGSSSINSAKPLAAYNSISIKEKISTNTTSINNNTTLISTNTTDITANTGKISTNTTNITANTGNISTNTTNITANTGKINTNTQDIHGSVALSSAMSALPNSSDDAAGTCGMGTGFHKGLSAISAGCAMDFSTLSQNSNLSPLFKRASVNWGTSAIMNSKGFSNFALRAGLTFKLGAKKSSGTDLSMDEDLQRYSTGTNTRIAELKKENDVLQNKVMQLESMQEELNAKLDALIASLNNG